MTDRFDEMAVQVQADMDAYAVRQSIDARRRIIADALRRLGCSTSKAEVAGAEQSVMLGEAVGPGFDDSVKLRQLREALVEIAKELSDTEMCPTCVIGARWHYHNDYCPIGRLMHICGLPLALSDEPQNNGEVVAALRKAAELAESEGM